MAQYFISYFATPTEIIENYRDEEGKFDLSLETLSAVLYEATKWEFPCGYLEDGTLISSEKETYFIKNIFKQVSEITKEQLRMAYPILEYDESWTMYRTCDIITGMLYLIGLPIRLKVVPYHSDDMKRSIKVIFEN